MAKSRIRARPTRAVTGGSRPVRKLGALPSKPSAVAAIVVAHDCPCPPQPLASAEVCGIGDGPTPAAAIEVARAAARLQLNAHYSAIATEHRCKGDCLGTVILRWPDAPTYEAIIGAWKSKGPTYTYRAIHGGTVSAWIVCESLSSRLKTALDSQHWPNGVDFGDVVGWRLVAPGTNVA